MTGAFLNVLKPAGLTSHQVVAKIRALTGIRQVGHAGTLDPDATGVLPVAVGSYTRLLEWLAVEPKWYQATLVLGVLTDTGDGAGRPVGRSGPPFPDRAALEQAGRWLTGDVWQIPPQVSALKQQGRRGYQEVRQGRAVWPTPRRIRVNSLRVVSPVESGWQIEASVSAGSYIRALVRDWGYLVGQAAHLTHLRRTRVGVFSEADGWPLSALADLGYNWVSAAARWQDCLTLPMMEVTRQQAEAIAQGRVGQWPDLHAAHGDVLLTYRQRPVAVVTGPPWRYRKVLVKDDGL